MRKTLGWLSKCCHLLLPKENRVSYLLNRAANPMTIAERQWGIAQTIQFTKFTSCVGVLAKVKNEKKVIGIHLSLYDGDTKISTGNVPMIAAFLHAQNYDPGNVLIMGQIVYWKGSAYDVYERLVDLLRPRNTRQFADGTYRATVDDDGEIGITHQ